VRNEEGDPRTSNIEHSTLNIEGRVWNAERDAMTNAEQGRRCGVGSSTERGGRSGEQGGARRGNGLLQFRGLGKLTVQFGDEARRLPIRCHVAG
jgi:hypothetical protein